MTFSFLILFYSYGGTLMNRIVKLLFVLLVAGTSAAANATIVISHDNGVPTTGLPGFRTVTVTATSTVAGELIQGVDFFGGPIYNMDLGFFGPMNQVNPSGQPTVFQDLNAFFGATPVAQDSQFLFATNAPTG